MRWHPDLNKNDRTAEERFKWITQAYKVLSDPKSRFEWEIAGRPTFEIKEFETETPKITLDSLAEKSEHNPSNFSSSEKLLLVLISIVSLCFFNAFTS